MTNNIKHDESHFVIESWSPYGTYTNDVQIGGGEQETVDPLQGQPISAVLEWEADGQVLHTESKLVGTGEVMPTSRRSLTDKGQMCVELTTPNGLVCTRFFE